MYCLNNTRFLYSTFSRGVTSAVNCHPSFILPHRATCRQNIKLILLCMCVLYCSREESSGLSERMKSGGQGRTLGGQGRTLQGGEGRTLGGKLLAFNRRQGEFSSDEYDEA